MFRLLTLYDCNSFKLVGICLMAQNMVCLGMCSMGTYKVYVLCYC